MSATSFSHGSESKLDKTAVMVLDENMANLREWLACFKAFLETQSGPRGDATSLFFSTLWKCISLADAVHIDTNHQAQKQVDTILLLLAEDNNEIAGDFKDEVARRVAGGEFPTPAKGAKEDKDVYGALGCQREADHRYRWGPAVDNGHWRD